MLANVRGVRKQDTGLGRKIEGASLRGMNQETSRLLEEFVEISEQEAEIFNSAALQRRFIPSDIATDNAVKLSVRKLVRETNKIDSITDTLNASIKRVIRNNPTDPGKIVDGLEELFARNKQVTQSKALTIARTETNNIASFISQESGAITGDNVKQWVWSGVSREGHAAMNGQTVQIGEDFTNPLSGNSAPRPNAFRKASEDINCTCSIITLNVIDDQEAREIEEELAGVI